MPNDNVNDKVKGDLIYRRKVEEVIKTLVHEESVTNDAAVLGCMVWNAVRTMSAVDAAPVVHGRWISDYEDVLFSCSVCDTQISTSWDYEDLEWRFCPTCGAKMDGDGHE